jgi:cytochrome c oxidase subunit 2
MALAVVFFLLVIGSIVFHFWSPWWFTPIASNWGSLDDTIIITFWVTGIVFVAVNLFVAYCVFKYRKGKVKKADYEPENTKLETWLTVITAVGVVAMLAPGLVAWSDFVTVPEGAAEVEAVGQQWNWTYRYPGDDGVLGTVDPRNIAPGNPFGLDLDDPNGQDDRLVSGAEMHLPIDQPVKMLLRSKDVLHDFAVAQFRAKMDLVPGMVTYFWLTPTRTGSFEILCEELCGMAHHAMRGRVVVEDQSSYDDWLAGQPTFAETQAIPPGDAEAGAPLYMACGACHGAQGEGVQLLNSPKLSGQEDWYLTSQIENYKNGVRGAHEDDIFGQQMAPMAGTLVDEAAIQNVVAYIGTLPDEPAPTTVIGNADRGRAFAADTPTILSVSRCPGWRRPCPTTRRLTIWWPTSILCSNRIPGRNDMMRLEPTGWNDANARRGF